MTNKLTAGQVCHPQLILDTLLGWGWLHALDVCQPAISGCVISRYAISSMCLHTDMNTAENDSTGTNRIGADSLPKPTSL